LRSYEEEGLLAEVRAAGGEVFAITSEPQTLADEAQADWGLSYATVGDPHHEIRDELAARGWLDIFYNEDFDVLGRQWASHPKGYFQPAVVALDRDRRVLYRWRCVPNRTNISGAGARPAARYVWQQVQTARRTSIDAEPDLNPEMTSKDPPWLMFLLLLTAHGWFLRPKPFPLPRDGEAAWVNPASMLPRLVGFAVLWVAALILLPWLWVGLAAVLWLLLLTPGLLKLHRQFQNETAPG